MRDVITASGRSPMVEVSMQQNVEEEDEQKAEVDETTTKESMILILF